MNRLKVNLVLFLAAIYTLMAALYPFEFSGRTLTLDGSLHRQLWSLLAVRIRHVALDDFLANIVYFLPWGVLVYFLDTPRSSKVFAVLKAVLWGGMLSLTIEVCQIFFTKHPSFYDVLANTLGAGLGALFCAFSSIDLRQLAMRSPGGPKRWRAALSAALLLGIVPTGTALTKDPRLGLDVWDWHYTFQHGGGQGRESPWFGIVHGAAVYERALGPGEIAQSYRLAASSGELRRLASGGVVLFCSFGDRRGEEPGAASACGAPFHFALLPRSRYRWLHGGNGIDIFRPPVLRRERAAAGLFEAIRGRRELSIEAWTAPAGSDPGEAGNIDALAPRLSVRRAVAQGAEADRALPAGARFRGLRAVAIDAPAQVSAPERVHLVVTFKAGVRRLFVNGEEHSYNHFDLRLADFIVAFGNNQVAQIAYNLVFFFPVAILFACALAKRHELTGFLTAVAMAFGLLGMTEALQAYLFARSIDVAFVGYGFAVAGIGAVCGVFLARDSQPGASSPAGPKTLAG